MIVMVVACSTAIHAQRVTDKLDRGLVAIPARSGSGTFVSWRIFGEEYYNTEYNLYRDGTKLNDKPLRVSNYTDAAGKSGSKYQVAAVVKGMEQEKCAAVTRMNQQYIEFAVASVKARDGKDMTSNCNINDIALADLTGDGVSEFIVKRNYGADSDASGVYPESNKTAYNHLEVYNIKGERLWWIDLGPNMVSGPDEQYDAVGYDWDGDGKAEVLMRGADNMIIHHPDGTTTEIGNMNVNTRNTVRHDDANGAYTNSGAEYLLYMEGATGKPYSIGSGSTPLWMSYPLPRGSADDWGDGYGHRSTKHYFGAPFLDGRHPFIFLGRGCYTKHHMKAFSVDPATHKLTLYWEWANNNGWSDPWYGNGYHNFGIADVDWDGRDEICFGSMVIDDNGRGLSTCGLGHGDAQHCGDFDPYRHGQEIFACNEDEPAMNYRNATTSKIYYRLQSTSDDGRALCGNFSNSYPGAIGHSSQSGTISCVADKVISGGPTGFTNNFRIYWDGDLLEEGLDGASSREGASRVFKADGSIVFTADGTANCNWTKNTPSATGDILGDWREEIVARTSDNKYIRVYTTNFPTEYRNYTLWHDHQYRQGMVWESVGYNQPPHASYFIGELENITVAPPPFTMTGRTEIANGGSIGSGNDGQHVIVCETNDTEITVADGASPSVATFNVPSWVQGTNSTNTSGNPKINYLYYACNVKGGAFTGDTRLVKQGDGTLTLPAVEQTYTGNTDVWAGVLNFDGKLLNSSLWLNRFAELNSDGGAFRSIKMDYDAKLRPGGADKEGTITVDTLRLGFGSRVVFDVYNDGLRADQLKTSVVTIETKNWQYGPKYMTPVFEFTPHFGADADLAEGRYLLGEVGNVEGNLGDVKIIGLGNSHKSQLLVEDGKLYLEVAGMRDAGTVIWNGSTDSTWDLGNTENFLSSDGENNDVFVSGDKVYFTDDAQQFNVTLASELEADTIFVDATKAYSFGGTGSIVGNTVLVKRGTGNLTIKTDNTYTGGTRIAGGAVIVTSLSNANQAVGNLGGVVSSNTKFVMENGGELRTSAAVTQGSPMKMETAEGGVVQNANDFILNKPVSGTKLTKRGNGWMKLNVANGGLDTLVVGAGTVQCINANVPAKNVVYQGGTLRENTSTSYGISVPKGKVGTWYMANRSTYTNKITGEGTLTIYCVTEKGTNYYATRTPVQCNFNDFEGTIKPTSSVDDPALLRFTLNIAGGCPNGTFDLASAVEMQNSGKTFTIGKVTGTGSLGGSCTFSNGTSVGANTWRVGNATNFTWDGRVTSNAHFQKIGEGKMTAKGAWTTTGNVAVNEGELTITTSSSLGKGTLTVAKGATLSGVTSNSSTLENSSYTINGTMQVGSTKNSTTGAITLNDKNITFSRDSYFIIGASRCASPSFNGCTALRGINRITMNGTIQVNLIPSHSLEAGDSIRIFEAKTFTGNPQFDLPEIGNGLEWDTSRISEGLLFVTAGTGIDGLFAEEKGGAADIYNANGQVVRRNARSLNGLPRGIYFVRGRKIIVK